MNWLQKLLGNRGDKYRGDGFFVRIEPNVREVVSVIYKRHGTSLKLQGERIGEKEKGIHVRILQEIDAAQLTQIVSDLESAFKAMHYAYVIDRIAATDNVPEAEQKAAMAELYEMGHEIEILPGQQIRQSWRAGVPRPDIETLRKQTPRMMSLIQSLHGTRHRFEVLAKSQDF
jgi:hypothetical protein